MSCLFGEIPGFQEFFSESVIFFGGGGLRILFLPNPNKNLQPNSSLIRNQQNY